MNYQDSKKVLYYYLRGLHYAGIPVVCRLSGVHGSDHDGWFVEITGPVQDEPDIGEIFEKSRVRPDSHDALPNGDHRIIIDKVGMAPVVVGYFDQLVEWCEGRRKTWP